jgi:hypothetical protein
VYSRSSSSSLSSSSVEPSPKPSLHTMASACSDEIKATTWSAILVRYLCSISRYESTHHHEGQLSPTAWK